MSHRFRFDWFKIVAYAIVILFALFCVLPFYLLTIGSFTSEREIILDGYSFWPQSFSLDAYRLILAGGQIEASYWISIEITLVGTMLAVAFTTGLAYAIVMLGRSVGRPLGLFVYFTTLFGGGLVPFYLLVTQVLNLSETLWACVLPMLVNPFFVFIMVAFFRQLPKDLLEAARIDGANSFVVLFRIVLPISTPVLATIALFYGLAYWNSWYLALLFITNTEKFPLQLLLQNLLANVQLTGALQNQVPTIVNVPSYQLRMAMTLITIGPIVLVYPFLQRYFVKGLTLGATKG
jgi:putative aldouronate transport system permease protein